MALVQAEQSVSEVHGTVAVCQWHCGGGGGKGEACRIKSVYRAAASVSILLALVVVAVKAGPGVSGAPVLDKVLGAGQRAVVRLRERTANVHRSNMVMVANQSRMLIQVAGHFFNGISVKISRASVNSAAHLWHGAPSTRWRPVLRCPRRRSM